MIQRNVSRRTRSGAAMVEFAPLLPLLMFVLVASIDFARVFYCDQTIINCARNGAAYLSDPYSPLRNNPNITSYQQAALMDAQSLSPALTASNVTSSESGNNVTVTVTYQFSTITSYLTGYTTVTLTKSVTMSQTQQVPN